MTYRTALIVGAGSGLSASLARLFVKNGMQVALAARATDKLAALAAETRAQLFACDASQEGQVEKLFARSRASSLHPTSSFTTRVFGPAVR